MSPQTTSKSRKVTVQQLCYAWSDLQTSKYGVINAKAILKETERVFNNLTKRASAATCKKFIETCDLGTE